MAEPKTFSEFITQSNKPSPPVLDFEAALEPTQQGLDFEAALEPALEPAQQPSAISEMTPEMKAITQGFDVEQPEEKGFFAEAFQDVKEGVSGFVEDAKSRGGDLADRLVKLKEGELGGGEAIGALPAAVLGTFADLVGNTVLTAGKVALPQDIEEAIAETVGSGVSKVAQTEVAQNIADKWNALPEKTKTNIKDAGTVLEFVTEFFGGGVGKKAVTEGIETGIDVTKTGIKKGTEALAEQAEKRTVKQIADAKIEVDKTVGQIVQGKTQDVPKAVRALGDIDTVGVKDFKTLNERVQNRISDLGSKQDEIFAQFPDKIALKDLARETTTKGGQKIAQNHVDDTFNILDEFYESTNNLEKLTDLRTLREAATTEGLDLKQVNDLARQLNRDISSIKSFTVTGKPKSGLTAQAAENTRKGLKNTVRDRLPDDTAKILDGKMSDLFNTKELVDKMVEKANGLAQKVKERGFVEKGARAVGRAIDFSTFGGTSAFLTSFLPSNVGNKILNSLDLEEELKKNLAKMIKSSQKASQSKPK